MEISALHRKKLKAMAHHLNPLVMVGKHGVTEALMASADKVLADHELVKVRFIDHKSVKKELIGRITDAIGSCFISMTGNVAVIYRESPDVEKQTVTRVLRTSG